MSENRPPRRVLVLVFGVVLMIAGAVVIGVSQTAFAPQTVRIKSFASGNAFAMSDEQMMSNIPFADFAIGDGAKIRERIAKRQIGTGLGAALVGVGLIVALLGLRRRRAAAAPASDGDVAKHPPGTA